MGVAHCRAGSAEAKLTCNHLCGQLKFFSLSKAGTTLSRCVDYRPRNIASTELANLQLSHVKVPQILNATTRPCPPTHQHHNLVEKEFLCYPVARLLVGFEGTFRSLQRLLMSLKALPYV